MSKSIFEELDFLRVWQFLVRSPQKTCCIVQYIKKDYSHKISLTK